MVEQGRVREEANIDYTTRKIPEGLMERCNLHRDPSFPRSHDPADVSPLE